MPVESTLAQAGIDLLHAKSYNQPSMNTDAADEQTVAKGEAILRLARIDRDHERELKDRLFQPVIPRWMHVTVICLALAADLINRTLGGTLVVIPAWLLFDQFLESRARSRAQAIYDWIEHRTSQRRGEE